MSHHIDFAEGEEEHAQRLSVSYNFVRVRRKLLKRLLQGATHQELVDWKFSGGGITWWHTDATAEEVMRTLAVKPADDNPHLLVPTRIVITSDLAHGQMIKKLRDVGFRFGGEGLPRTTLAPPYGYKRVKDRLVPDVEHRSHEAIRLAFRLIVSYEPGPVPWSDIAAELNEHNYKRKSGKPWTGDAVRDLTRVTTYAGVYRPWKKDEAPVEVRDEIDPLIPLPLFIRAARLGRGVDRYGRTEPWLRDLEKFLRDDEEEERG